MTLLHRLASNIRDAWRTLSQEARDPDMQVGFVIILLAVLTGYLIGKGTL